MIAESDRQTRTVPRGWRRLHGTPPSATVPALLMAGIAGLNRRTLHGALDAARRRLRWLRHPPRVRGAIPRMFPGALRLDQEEEEAAVAAVREVMRSKKLFRFYGPSRSPFTPTRVRDLERAFAHHLGARHTLAVNSGTSALVTGLAALGVGPGDEVIVPAYTWISTASAVLALGAVPILAEVDDSLTLNPDDARQCFSPHTRGIIAVHMRGAPARLDALRSLTAASGIFLMEDVAQAAGGRFGDRSLGTIGDVGAFSFQMSKILTAGEGGLVVTSDRQTHLRAQHRRQVSYSADMCPVTLDLLRRAVHIDVSPDLTEVQTEQMAAAITAAVERLL